MQNDPEILARLRALAEPGYRDFSAKLIPDLPKERILGVRTPALRQMAKELARAKDFTFLNNLPHTWFEEDQLHAFLLEQIKDYDVCLRELERFLPFVNNWATCDQMAPKALLNNPARTEERAFAWLVSDHPYTVRYGVGTLMRWYLDDRFSPRQMRAVAALPDGDYYVHMMIAWYFATALAKQYEAALPYFTSPLLSARTHNKALQKARESYRISPERKEYLKTLIRR